MGRTHWYECGKCGYRAKVSGRADRGLNFFVQTVSCSDCRQLYDAVTKVRVPDARREHRPGVTLKQKRLSAMASSPPTPPSFQSILNRLPYRGVRYFRWLSYRPQCPVAAWHRVSEWTEPGKCPRCGLHMERNALPYRIWE
jgi:hypothetical protein